MIDMQMLMILDDKGFFFFCSSMFMVCVLLSYDLYLSYLYNKIDKCIYL